MWIIEAGQKEKKIEVLININFFKKKFGEFYPVKELRSLKE